MPCSCNQKKGQSVEVITPAGKVVYTSSSKAAAEGVAKRYAGSRVEPAGTAAKEKASGQNGTAPATAAAQQNAAKTL